jgi:hypothetical protein
LAKILFTNERSSPIGLVIEPWADFATVPAGANVIFEFGDSPPPEVQFVVRDSGDAFIYINSEHVRMRMPGKECDWGFGKRAPSFPILK